MNNIQSNIAKISRNFVRIVCQPIVIIISLSGIVCKPLIKMSDNTPTVRTYRFTDNDPRSRVSKSRRFICILTIVLLTLLVLAVCLAVGLSALYEKQWSSQWSNSRKKWRRFDTDGSPLEYFGVSDAIHITWYHGANSQEKIKEAIEGNYMMIEGDITLRWYGYPNQTDEPIMAHPPDVDSDLTLDEWIEYIIARPDKGMKLDFKNNEVVKPALEILASKGSRVRCPVWLNADVVKGPVIVGQPVDPEKFLADVNDIYPKVTLSLGWKTSCCLLDYTREDMEKMWDIVKDTTQPVTFPVRAALFRNAWEEFLWLLDQDIDRFSFTVWTPSGADDWEGASEWDMLYCRNDANITKIYYDLPGQKFIDFQILTITAGTPLNFFPLTTRDGLNVTWAHAVNSKAKLDIALNSDVFMLEADVILRNQGLPNQTDIPVMAHPPATDSDITLEEWMTRVVQTDKGIKLDFKYIEAMEPSLTILRDMRHSITQPVFINADIFQGPGGTSTPVDSAEFIRVTNELFPWATLSIGWTTAWNNEPDDPVYDEDMVARMMEYAENLSQPVTFPVRAVMVRRSWDVLKTLLFSRGQTFTVWSSSDDNLDADDMVYVRQNTEIDQIFYDLPPAQMKEFLDKLNITMTL